MRAVADADHEPLERWAGMREAEVAVRGTPASAAGRSRCSGSSRARCRASAPCRPTARSSWTSGTLFPQASKKIARAINAASGRRPLVVLANLAGFDGSPESMRRLQLEYGAEIGRAIVNFDGPIAFCVISRFHGGAFVVFSRRLNAGPGDDRAGGRARLGHRRRAGGRGRVRARGRRAHAQGRADRGAGRADRGGRGRRARAAARRARRRSGPRSGRRSSASWRPSSTPSTASQRAVEVGSVDRIVPAAELRPQLIEAIERGMRARGGAGGRNGRRPALRSLGPPAR